MHVVISARARDDLGAIWDFLALRSVAAADRVTAELIDRALEIGEAPLAAPIAYGLGAGETRRVNVRSWAIFYEVHEGYVHILRFVQGRGDPASWS